MTFGEHVFLYCERGTNEALSAEPINAISNTGFFLAALIFWQLVLWRPREERSVDHYLFVALVFLIGLGSLAFHLYADEGSALADIIPIALFMLVYLGFALNRFLAVPPGWTVLLAVTFTLLVGAAGHVYCWDGGIGLPGMVAEAKPCLNGSVVYLPALGALIVIGIMVAGRHHKAAPYILWAAALFTVSVILRSVDLSLCDQVVIDGSKVGTHFIWHLLNAVVIFLLLRASLEAGTKAAVPETEHEPDPPSVEATPAKDGLKENPEMASAGEDSAVKQAEAEPGAPEPKTEGSKTDVEPEGEKPGAEDAETQAPKKGKWKKPSVPA